MSDEINQEKNITEQENSNAEESEVVNSETNALAQDPYTTEGLDLDKEFNRALVGVLRAEGRNGVVLLDRGIPDIGRNIYIHESDLNGAPFDMKVVVEIIGTADMTYGRIVEVLGDPGRSDVAIDAIIATYRLSQDFPQEVLKEVEGLGVDPDPEEIEREIQKGRRDLRDYETCTIDGLDARDLDDAIDLERLGDGYRLWVHIADVSHYLCTGSAMNKEAIERGNSVYLVDRVLPMLPPKLSNGLCSLNPHKDRLAMSCRVDFDKDGKVIDGEVFESVIQSKVRSSYEEVMEIFETGASKEKRPDWFVDKIYLMRELSKLLSARRAARGALIFEFPETKIKLDAEGNPTDVFGEWQDESNQIIESFMIAANEFVAALCDRVKVPAVYRVHEEPDVEKLQMVSQLLRERGIKLRLSSEPSPMELRKVLESLKSEPFGPAFSNLILRALAKARYDVQDKGHYGLASSQYCHFTAPIRRYADVCVHRALKAYLHKASVPKNPQSLPSIAKHISETERVAVDAERDTVDQKIVEYYAKKLGEEFEGKISGISSSMMYIQLDSTAEGAIMYANMDRGYIKYDAERMFAYDTGNGETFFVGDPVTIRVAKADVERRFLDFQLLSHEALSKPGQKAGRVSYDHSKKAPKKPARTRKGRDKRRRNKKRRR